MSLFFYFSGFLPAHCKHIFRSSKTIFVPYSPWQLVATPVLQLSFENIVRQTKGVVEVCISEHNDLRLGKVCYLSYCIEKSLVLLFEIRVHLVPPQTYCVTLSKLFYRSFLPVCMGDTSLPFKLLENWTC